MHFCGEYNHALDEKKRLVIPAKFRNFIKGDDREGFYLLISPAPDEKCLRLYTPTGWKAQVRKIRQEALKVENPTHFYRLYASQTEFIPADTQCRIVLPQKRMEQAGLSRELLLVGNFDWIEIWDPKEYESHRNRLMEQFSGNMTRSLMPDVSAENPAEQ